MLKDVFLKLKNLIRNYKQRRYLYGTVQEYRDKTEFCGRIG